MSQIFKDVTSSPAVATTYTADSGSAVPAANNLNIFGNDTTTYDADGISTIGSGSTITVQLNNRLQGTGSTTGAVTADIITFGLGATPASFYLSLRGCVFESATPSGAGYKVDVAVRTDGATATLIDTDSTAQEDTVLADADLSGVVSGNNVILRATGVAGLTLNWNVSGTYERAT